MLYLPGANLPPGGWDGLGEMEVPPASNTAPHAETCSKTLVIIGNPLYFVNVIDASLDFYHVHYATCKGHQAVGPIPVPCKPSPQYRNQVVGHFTVHGLSVSVSVNTGAGGVQANINTNNNVCAVLTTYFLIKTITCDH